MNKDIEEIYNNSLLCSKEPMLLWNYALSFSFNTKEVLGSSIFFC